MFRSQFAPPTHLIPLILLLTFSFPLRAETFPVSNLNDSGPGSLRQAILDAKNAAGNDVITFQAGLTGTILLTSGELLIDSNLTISGPGASVLAVDGRGSGDPLLNRVFKITPGVIVTLDGLTIKNGFIPNCWTNPNPPPPSICTDDGGAGIENSGTLTLRNSVVSGNFTAKIGGGISNKTSGTLTIINSTVSGNETSRYGGGIFNVGALTLVNSIVSNNEASVFSGGGIYNSGTLTIRDSTLSGNSASQEDGGGIYNVNPGKVMVINSTISGNSANRYGGGIANCDILASSSNKDTILKVFNSTISGNSGDHGGGVTNCGHTEILNSTITNNEASATSSASLISGGGGIFSRHAIQWYGETLTIGNSWVAGNRSGDGITAKGNEILIWMGAQSLENTPLSTLGHNVFGDNKNIGVWADGAYYDGVPYLQPSDLTLQGPTSTALGPLTDNGGPTKTHLPTMNGGPIDLGDNSLIPPDPLTNLPLATDQRGQPRIQNNTVDIGAVEGSTAIVTTQHLTVTKTGGCDTTVTSNPAGINCGAICEADFNRGASVTLTAPSIEGCSFDGWNGDCTNTTGPCVLTMDADKSVTASFVMAPPNTYTVTLAKTGTGSGTVGGDGDYAAGATVTLTATPNAGSTFAGWSPSPCAASFTMPASALTCTATFTLNNVTLTVNKAGTGNGTVGGGGTFPYNTTVTPTATAAAGSTFAGWNPASCGTPFALTANTTCTATFTVGAALPGDVNGDGNVDALDVVAVINAVLGIQPLPAADVNKDGSVNALDVVFVINRVLGIPLA